jgi:hypothetical protein
LELVMIKQLLIQFRCMLSFSWSFLSQQRSIPQSAIWTLSISCWDNDKKPALLGLQGPTLQKTEQHLSQGHKATETDLFGLSPSQQNGNEATKAPWELRSTKWSAWRPSTHNLGT